MKRLQSKALFAFAVATVLFAASPASAATWACTAKNASSVSYTASAIGVFSLVVRDRARAKALAACRAKSVVPASCYVVSCTKTG